MDKKAKNVFDDMLNIKANIPNNTQIATEPIKETPNNDSKSSEVVAKRGRALKVRGNINTTAEASKSVLYRTTPGFYEELAAFAKIKGLSMNTIIETSIIAYMDQPDNREHAKLARSIANSIRR